VCGEQLKSAGGFYAEATHIKPLGAPHNGPDKLDKLLCLCPNHHVLFSNGGFTVGDDLKLIGIKGKLKLHKWHKPNVKYLRYHREHYYDSGSPDQ
jgi:putative restriction endonuclease